MRVHVEACVCVCNVCVCTCGGDDMQQHLDLAGEEGPGAVGVVPADHVALLPHTHLAQDPLRHTQVGLAHTWRGDQTPGEGERDQRRETRRDTRRESRGERPVE